MPDTSTLSHNRDPQQVLLSSVLSGLSDSLSSLQVQQQTLGRLRPPPPPQDQARHPRQGQQIQVEDPDLHQYHTATLSSHEDCLETREFSQTCSSEDLTAGMTI